MKELSLILIVLSGIFALIQVFRIKDKFARIINIVLAVSIGVSLVQIPQIAIDGFYLFSFGCLLIVLYPFADSSFSNQKKLLLTIMGLVQLNSMAFLLGRLPWTDYAYLACIITIVIYFYVLAKDIKSYSNEIGFMTVLMADAVIKVSTILASSAG